jgi:hypothetical protein
VFALPPQEAIEEFMVRVEENSFSGGTNSMTNPKNRFRTVQFEFTLVGRSCLNLQLYIDCQYEMRITFSKPWIPSESGEHSEDQTSIH